jgi:hypothetical protein
MATRILGPTGSKRRHRFLFVPILLVACAALFYIGGAQAVHDTGRFQLDGDAATGTNTAGTPAATDDWDKVCYEVAVKPVADGGGGLTAAQALAKCGIGTPTTGATETSWVAEPDRAASIFTGGGSKDPQNLDQWAWKDAGGLPDKDNLEHAYAARYSLTPNASTCPSGGAATCDLLFAGLDRFDNSGDAQNGVWFFQNKVTTAGGKVGGATGFTGLHTNNDLLIVSDFSNGGTTSTITVYTWDDACTATGKPFPYCADANLHLQESSDAANCAAQDSPTPVHGDAFCGIVNPSTITMPWSFLDKSGTPANGALNGEFYEEGINLSLLHLAGTCFSSVLSETRSSTSTTATLKDFILGQLGKCVPNVTTQVQKGGVDFNGTVQPGQAVNDTATVTVTGATSPDDATGTVDFFLCSNTTPNPTPPPDFTPPACASGGVSAGSGKSLTDTSNPANTHDGISGASSDDVNTAANPLPPGAYCFRAKATLTNYASPDAVTNTTTECFSVAKLPTNTVTTPVDGSGTTTTTITLGSSIFDKAVVTGSAAGGDPTGTVNFFICGPIASPATCDGTTNVGTPVSGNPQTCVPDGTVPPNDTTYTCSATSGSVTPTAIGRYCFRGEYSGNTVYNGSSDSSATECFTVTTSSSGTSVQNWLPNDHVVLSTATGANLTGTLDIDLRSGSCTGTVVYQEPAPYDGSVNTVTAPITVDTTNSTFKVHASPTDNTGTYYWSIVFNPNSSFATGFTKCETSTVTINDNP